MKIIFFLTFAVIAFFGWSALTMMNPALPFSPVVVAVVAGIIGAALGQ